LQKNLDAVKKGYESV